MAGSMVGTLAARELRSLFVSPLAWAILGVVQLLLAWVFLNQLDQFMGLQARLAQVPGAPGATELIVVPMYASAAVVFMLVVPLLTMRLIAEERRSGTLPLLFSAPVSMTEIVLGKYVGVLGFLLLLAALVSLMPLTLWAAGGLDPGLWLSALLGLVLVMAAFAALGLYLSTLTDQPTVAAVASFGVLLLLWLIDWAGQQGTAGSLLSYLSILRHFEAFSRGLFDSADLAYYLLFVVAFLVLSIRRLDARRLQG